MEGQLLSPEGLPEGQEMLMGLWGAFAAIQDRSHPSGSGAVASCGDGHAAFCLLQVWVEGAALGLGWSQGPKGQRGTGESRAEGGTGPRAARGGWGCSQSRCLPSRSPGSCVS